MAPSWTQQEADATQSVFLVWLSALASRLRSLGSPRCVSWRGIRRLSRPPPLPDPHPHLHVFTHALTPGQFVPDLNPGATPPITSPCLLWLRFVSLVPRGEIIGRPLLSLISRRREKKSKPKKRSRQNKRFLLFCCLSTKCSSKARR